jgi:signal transduction histidine kinase
VSEAAEQPEPNVVLVRDAQQRTLLRAMMNRLPSLMAMFAGAEHRIQYLNQAAATAFGDRARPGLSLVEAVAELRGQELLAALDAVQASGEPVQLDEASVRLRRPGSDHLEDRYFTIVAMPLRDPREELIGSVLNAVDVTEQVQARRNAEALARENAALYEQASAVLRLRDELLDTLAHDVRAPLATIQMGLQLIEREYTRGDPLDPARLAAVLEPVQAAIARLGGVLNELAETARAQVGQPLALRTAPIDLGELVERVVATQQITTVQHRIRILVEQPSLLGRWDGQRLERVIANLLGNAIKYSPTGGEITVALSRDAGSHEAILSVTDQGIGIPAADLPHVFERSYRGSGVIGRMPGSGLGLTSVREVVEQHGGRVAIASADGEGTTVTVRLPLA